MGTADGAGSGALQSLMDRAEITDLLHRFTDSVDAKDWGLFRSLFTSDAIVDFTGAFGKRVSLDEAIVWIDSVVSDQYVPKSQHCVTNIRIELDGDTATARAYHIDLDTMSDGDGGRSLLMIGGHYNVLLRREDGAWRMTEMASVVESAHRAELVEFQVPVDDA